MKHLVHLFLLPMIATGCLNSDHKEKKVSPVKVESAAPGEMPKVVLTPEAEKRLGIEIISAQSVGLIPSSAVLYDLQGVTWVYARTAPQTFSRIRFEFWKNGPFAEVVIHGAAELFGAESGVGK